MSHEQSSIPRSLVKSQDKIFLRAGGRICNISKTNLSKSCHHGHHLLNLKLHLGRFPECPDFNPESPDWGIPGVSEMKPRVSGFWLAEHVSPSHHSFTTSPPGPTCQFECTTPGNLLPPLSLFPLSLSTKVLEEPSPPFHH